MIPQNVNKKVSKRHPLCPPLSVNGERVGVKGRKTTCSFSLAQDKKGKAVIFVYQVIELFRVINYTSMTLFFPSYLEGLWQKMQFFILTFWEFRTCGKREVAL